MTTLNTPAIGDEVLDPNEKFDEVDGLTKYDQLLADGSEVDESKYPEYYATLETSLEEVTLVETSRFTLEGFTDSIRSSHSDGVYLWLGYEVNGFVKKFDLYGNLIATFPSGTNNYIQGITEDLDGFLYWVNTGSGADAITKADKDGNIIWHRLITAYTSAALGIAYADGVLYVFDTSQDAIHTFTTEAEYIQYVGVGTNSGISEYNGNYWAGRNVGASFTGEQTRADSTASVFTQVNDTQYVGVEDTYLVIGTIEFKQTGYRPIMDSGPDECPYRVVADKYTPSIGEVRPSNLDKYSEDGIAMFDNLLCDGSVVDVNTHPLLWETLTPSTEYNYTGDDYSLSLAETTWSHCFDGEFYWVVSNSQARVYQYDIDWVPTGFSFVTADGVSALQSPVDITWDGATLWIADAYTDHVSQYSTTGVHMFKKDFGNDLTSITYGDGTFWIGFFSFVVEYGTDWSLTGRSFNSNTPTGITWDNETVWVVRNTGSITQYDVDGTGAIDIITRDDATGVFVYDAVMHINTRYSVHRYEKTRNLPTNTSTYPNFPDHVIADLTEDV